MLAAAGSNCGDPEPVWFVTGQRVAEAIRATANWRPSGQPIDFQRIFLQHFSRLVCHNFQGAKNWWNNLVPIRTDKQIGGAVLITGPRTGVPAKAIFFVSSIKLEHGALMALPRLMEQEKAAD
ncbi:MAG TPA: hypothetical protein HPQ04_02235 [Rhodospirillaceae bacterium]|nr:hypothetical protein [Rhodospirillaceae bacterium]